MERETPLQVMMDALREALRGHRDAGRTLTLVEGQALRGVRRTIGKDITGEG